MKTKSRKRRGATPRAQAKKANFRRVAAIIKRNMRSLERRIRKPPRPRRIDPEIVRLCMEHALKLISLDPADAVLFLQQERDASVAK